MQTCVSFFDKIGVLWKTVFEQKAGLYTGHKF